VHGSVALQAVPEAAVAHVLTLALGLCATHSSDRPCAPAAATDGAHGPASELPTQRALEQLRGYMPKLHPLRRMHAAPAAEVARRVERVTSPLPFGG